jgi:AcrR family transcriptional regulator
MAAVKNNDPRANQKARTRAAIIEAGKRLHRNGRMPTIDEVATEARVSRATAYRYFPTKEALLVELTGVTPGVEPVEEMLTSLRTRDIEKRMLRLIDTFMPIVDAEEEQMRTAIRVYQDIWLRGHRGGDDSPIVREGRRMRWLDQVLEPASDLSDEHRRRLRAALALTLGIDALVVMKDVCRLNDEEALATLKWAASVLLRAGLGDEREQAE